MAISLAPMASLSLLTGVSCTSGRRCSLNLPMAAASFSFPSSSFSGSRITKVRQQLMVVRASIETDGNDTSGSELPPLERSDKPVPVESLPLESKQQMLLEQKLRMKLAKKIRLRRNRLVRKRRMRKKGRWPPSKMKKNKNV